MARGTCGGISKLRRKSCRRPMAGGKVHKPSMGVAQSQPFQMQEENSRTKALYGWMGYTSITLVCSLQLSQNPHNENELKANMAYALKLHIQVLFDASTYRGQLAAISHAHAYMTKTIKETKHDVFAQTSHPSSLPYFHHMKWIKTYSCSLLPSRKMAHASLHTHTPT